MTMTESPFVEPTMWNLQTLSDLYQQPFIDLLYQAQQVHRRFHDPHKIQLCTLANIKSGHCPEDCAYCPQSARYQTDIDTWSLPPVEEIVEQALDAQKQGTTRFCMGAAWREVKNNQDFEHVLDLVRSVKALNMEVCVTLGMLTLEQAQQLKLAGVTAYNHNIDTSEEYYDQIITTRTFQDRLNTIANVQEAGMQVCCGGILGLGETTADRISFIHTLAQMDPPPQSIPVNALVPVEGTPLANQKVVSPFEMARTIATVRIVIPTAMIRLSAGRLTMSDEAQTLCFMAGANSIFTGDKLLTTQNPGYSHDQQLLETLGLTSFTQPVSV